jgi:hypothetical protein
MAPLMIQGAIMSAWVNPAAARTYDQFWAVVGHVGDLFSGEECYNCFKASGYEAD